MKANLFKTIALSVLALLFLAPSHLKAQVANPYKITNNLPCKIDLKYEFYRMTADQVCNSLCASGGLSLPPGASIPVAYGCNACAVKITIIAINGVALMPPLVAAFNMPPIPSSANAMDPSGCSPSGMIRLNVFPGGAQITP